MTTWFLTLVSKITMRTEDLELRMTNVFWAGLFCGCLWHLNVEVPSKSLWARTGLGENKQLCESR